MGHSTSTDELLAALDRARTPRTRMLWLCNPHNPLGLALAAPMLQALAGWALRHGLRLLVDEVWSDIVYPPLRHQAAAALDPETARNTLTVYGFSKNFGLAGLRVGCLLCPDRALAVRLADAAGAAQTISGVATLSQWAAVAAMEEAEPWLDAYVAHLDRQRHRLAERAARWPHILLVLPPPTVLALLDARAIDPDEEALCRRLREEARVALVPGSARWFGPGAAGHLRLSFATSRGILDEALDRIDRYLGMAVPGQDRHLRLPVADS
jgi:bifunctional pyridoxal-dependent enzyme with beta-cystathionase and maltose regulon repressor activities